MSRESKLIVFVAVLASLLEIIDTSIVNVAIPTMMGNLGATIEDISWVVTGYIIANAIVLPLSAWLGERIGRRQYFVGCILAFTATSVACGFAPNLLVLTIFRILQGLAGGALLPTSQTLIYEQFPKEKAGIAGAIFGMSVMIGPTLGPTLGGYLTDNFGWRSIFNVNLPLGLLAAFIGFLVVKNPERAPLKPGEKKSSIDAYGLALLAISIGCLQYVLERGQADEWFESRAIVINTIIAVIALPTFVWWELRVKDPVINIRLFKNSIVTNGVLLMASLGFFLYGLVFILPIFVGRIFHYDATQTGMLFIPGSLLTAFIMPFVGRQMSKTDPKILIFIGLVSLEICMATMLQFSTLTSKTAILGSLFIRGFALAFLFVPINSSILSQFKGANLGQVSGLLNLSRQVGGSMGISLIDTLIARFSNQNYINVVSHVSLLNPQTQQAYYQGLQGLSAKMVQTLGMTKEYSASLTTLAARVDNQVFMLSFLQTLAVIMMIFALSFIPLYFIRLREKVTGDIAAH
jgi:DHA2 family multidrug resistance protein